MNKDFGSIFSTLLPGANARLAPPEGSGVLDGLEFKVALGNTWKENLTELSGGQRLANESQSTKLVFSLFFFSSTICPLTLMHICYICNNSPNLGDKAIYILEDFLLDGNQFILLKRLN